MGVTHWILVVFDKYINEVARSQETIEEYLNDDGELLSRSSSNFFRWFYTGSVSDLYLGSNKKSAVDSFRSNLTKKENKSGFLFEFNWYKALSDVQPKYALEDIYQKLPKGQKTENKSYYDDYLACQLAFLALLKQNEPDKYGHLYDYYLSNLDLNRVSPSLSFAEFSELIQSPTFFSELDGSDALSGKLFKKLSKLPTTPINKAIIHKLEFHRELLFSLCRLDHAFIDLYTSFLESKSIDLNLVKNFITNISNQVRLTELSSYRILKDLNENIELVLKLNFEDYTNKTKSEFRAYIHPQLAKNSPVAGASGSGGDKTGIARRFRMPGYPMILVSTNVLQEGEDLHTFCDSVSHYGLSASPIAIEQKNGRVDRINSLSHRKLTKCEGYKSSDLEKEFIQVFFPHVKESIEYGQMISISSNMNDYILSLNEINTDNLHEIRDVSINDTESFRQGIKPQIRTYLKTPFKPVEPKGLDDIKLIEGLGLIQKGIQEREDHVRNLMSEFIDRDYQKGIEGINSSQYLQGKRLRAMRHFGELLFSFTKDYSKDCIDEDEYQNANYRFIMDDTGSIFKNIETYVGLEDELHRDELRLMEACIDGEMNATSSDADLSRLIETIKNNPKQILSKFVKNNLDGIDIQFSRESNVVFFGFNTHFLNHTEGRKHAVSWQQNNGFISFNTRVVSAGKLKMLQKSFKPFSEKNSVRKFLMKRNRIHDIVNFYQDKSGGISVRINHPDLYLHANEFMLACYLVATRADRLEFILNDEDTIGV